MEYGGKVRDAFVPGALFSETDCDGRITYICERLTNLSAYSKDELLGEFDNFLVHSETPDETLAMIGKVITSGKIFTGVMKERTKDGTYFWVDATIVPVKNTNGHIVKYVNARYLITDNLMGEYLYNRLVTKLA